VTKGGTLHAFAKLFERETGLHCQIAQWCVE